MNNLLDALDYLADLGRRIRESANRPKDSESANSAMLVRDSAEFPTTQDSGDDC